MLIAAMGPALHDAAELTQSAVDHRTTKGVAMCALARRGKNEPVC